MGLKDQNVRNLLRGADYEKAVDRMEKMEMVIEQLTIQTQYGKQALSYTEQFIRLKNQLKNGDSVLDLCCGYGCHALYLCEHGVQVTACDSDSVKIEKLRLNYNQFPGLNADICYMSDLPYNDNSFDCVMCYSALHHQCIRQLEKTFSEVKRVCKTGGFFSFDILSRSDMSCGIGEQIEPFTYVGGREGEEDVPHHYVDEAELLSLLQEFGNIHMREVLYQYELNHQKMASAMFCVEAIAR